MSQHEFLDVNFRPLDAKLVNDSNAKLRAVKELFKDFRLSRILPEQDVRQSRTAHIGVRTHRVKIAQLVRSWKGIGDGAAPVRDSLNQTSRCKSSGTQLRPFPEFLPDTRAADLSNSISESPQGRKQMSAATATATPKSSAHPGNLPL